MPVLFWGMLPQVSKVITKGQEFFCCVVNGKNCTVIEKDSSKFTNNAVICIGLEKWDGSFSKKIVHMAIYSLTSWK